MKQIIIDVVRGIFVGLIVWYILRPNEPAFDRIAEAVDEGKEIGESFISRLMDSPSEFINYPMEQIIMAGGAGAVLGIVFWMIRSKKTKKTKPTVTVAKKTSVRGKKK